MNKIFVKSMAVLLALLCCLSGASLASFAAGAETSVAVTVADGTYTNIYIPSYSYYNRGKAQYVIPASELSALSGKTLTALRWYLASNEMTRDVEVLLSEIESDTLRSSWSSTILTRTAAETFSSP